MTTRPTSRWGAHARILGRRTEVAGNPCVLVLCHRKQRKPVTTAKRVSKSRARMRAKGMRLVQFWVPDTRAPGLDEELARQCRVEAEWAKTAKGREEIDFWERVAADANADLDE